MKGFDQRAGFTNRHHIFPKARMKKRESRTNNIINLDERRHAAFHLLFQHRTLREAAAVLLRTADMIERRAQ